MPFYRLSGFLRFFFILLSLVAVALRGAIAQSLPNERMDKPPRLVVLLVVSGLRYDDIETHWEQFSPRGIPRLVRGGVYCQNARQSYLVGNDATGTATIATGALPSEHAVNSRYWFPTVSRQRVDLIADTKEHTIGGPYDLCKYSPRQLLVPTLSDAWRMAFPNAKIYSIALKPLPAMLLGGRSADGAIWLETTVNRLVSSSFYGEELPAPIAQLNDRRQAEQFYAGSWMPKLNLSAVGGMVGSKNESSIFAQTLARDIEQIRKKGVLPENAIPKGATHRLLYAPLGNRLVREATVQMVEGLQLGKAATPDLLMLHFSATGGITSLYGVESVQAIDALLHLDADIESLIDYLDVSVGKQNYLLALTSSYASESSPRYLEHWNLPAGTFSPAQALYLLNAYLGALYSHSKLAIGYAAQQIYLDELAIEQMGVALPTVEQQAAKFLGDMSGISRVYTSTELETGYSGTGRLARAARGYHPKRSGNLLIDLLPGWVAEAQSSPSAKGATGTTAQGLPLIFYGWKLKPGRSVQSVGLEDVAPTICRLLHIAEPGAATGNGVEQVINWEMSH